MGTFNRSVISDTNVAGAILALGSAVRMGVALLTTSLSIRWHTPVPAGPLATHGRFVSVELQTERLPIGAHLISPRGLYIHHGIYLGSGEVAHYSGLSSSLKAGPIEVINLERFANGRPVWLFEEQGEFAQNEIARRARSRVGERQYKLLSNNCEHFCNWCISGKSCSEQIKAYLHHPRRFLSFISTLDPSFVA